MADQRQPDVWTVARWALGGLIGVLFIGFAIWAGPLLLTRHPAGDLNELRARNDVRTTLVQALAGLAVAGGLIVTYNTYRQNKKEQERTYRQRVDEDRRRQAEQDRTYQQIKDEQDRRYKQIQAEQDRTHERELYAKAVEQLGHDHAAVRLGALYSLMQLGQDKPDRRKTVVDVVCAYLRMPYALPANLAAEHGATQQQTAVLTTAHDPAQELQVRRTAQGLLATHLHSPIGISATDAQHLTPSPDELFWPDISLDLTGATLVYLEFAETSVVRATFSGATFVGDAMFFKAAFTGFAAFNRATFSHSAAFNRASFIRSATFNGATFIGRALFRGADFAGTTPSFGKATFSADAMFKPVTHADLFEAIVLNVDDPLLTKRRVWPAGWTVRPNPGDSTRGTLIRDVTDPPSPHGDV